MATTVTTQSNFSDLVHNLIVIEVQDRLRATLPWATPGTYDEFVHTKGANSTFVKGTYADIVQNLATDKLSEGVAPTPVALAIDKTTFQGFQYGKVEQISDLADFTSPHQLAQVSAEKLGRWIAETINQVAYTALMSSGNIIYTGTTATANAGVSATLNAKDFARAVGRLKMANVQPFADGAYRAILSPRQVYDLRLETGEQSFSNAIRYTDASHLLAGGIGLFNGAEVIESSVIQTANTAGVAGVDVISACVYGVGALGLGDVGTVQTFLVNSPDSAQPLNQNIYVGAKCWLGAGYLNAAGDKAILLNSAGSILAAGQH